MDHNTERNRTHSILQRVPVILAVTAGSYGLPMPGPGRPDPRRSIRGRGGKACAAMPDKGGPRG